MDYDDNDFHSQNLHLGGEGSNKFPSILKPYSLPKFDFDDGLHGNLRFDNLVEAEDFLGIDSHVDNRWIEDFSRGSTDIQFSSSAPESCSIPWCNNVWSEATSTESVEMLLKSVGQEEIIPVQTDNKEANACDELGSIVEEMEPVLEQDSKRTHKVEDITDSRSRVAADDIPDTVSSKGIDVTEVNPSNDGKHNEVQEKDTNTECAFSGKQDADIVSDEWYNEYPQYGKDKIADNNTGTPKTIEVDQHQDQFAVSDQVSDAKFVERVASYLEDTVSFTSSKSATVDAKLTNFEVENQFGLQVHSAPVEIVERNNAVGSSEAPLSVVKSAKASGDRIDGSSNLHSDNSSSWITSAQFRTETSVEGCVPSSIQNESMQICEKNVDSEGGVKNNSATDLAVEEKASEKLAPVSNLTSAACNRTNGCSGSLLHGDGDKENKLDSELQSNTHSSKSKPEVVTESANLISSASGSVFQAFTGSERTEEAVGGPNEVGSSPLPAACITHSDKGDEILVKISTKAGLPDSMTSLHEKTRSDIASGTDRQTFGGSADQTSVKMDSLCKESPGDPVATCQVLDDQSQNKGDGVEEHTETASSKASAPNETCLDGKNYQQEIEVSTLSGDASGRHNLSTIVCGKGGVGHEKPTGTSHNDVRTFELSHGESDTGVKAPLVQCEAASERGLSIFHPVSLDPDDNAKKKGRGFTSVSSQSDFREEEIGLKRQPSFTIPSAGKDNKSSEVVNELPATSSMHKSETRSVQDPSLETPMVSNMAAVHSGSKSNSERKTRREPKSTNETSKRRRSIKETAAAKAGKISNVSSSPSEISQLKRSNDIQHHGHMESSNTKAFLFAVPASGLPDLNSSAPPTRVYQQPFTDLQQMQLRAQIFVYGSLIQGSAPDDTCMMSAFGDGNRSMWENPWRLSIERFQGQKSHLNTPETPLRLLSGSKASDQIVKQSATQSKVSLPPVVQATSIGAPTFINPVIPLSSPVWNVGTSSRDSLHSAGLSRGPGMDYQQAYSPFHNFPAQNHHWLSHSPFGGPWVGTPQTSTPDASAHFPIQLPLAQTVKESRTPHTSSSKPVPLAFGAQSGSVGVSTGSHLPDSDKITTPSRQSTDPQPRKRKKNLVAENSSLNFLHALPQADPILDTAVVAPPVMTSIPASFDSRLSTEKSISMTCPTSIEVGKGNQVSEQRDALSENSVSKLKDALVQAEGATALAATAVCDCQQAWDKMNKQKAYGLLPDVETKLASAAVTIAAAAAVAKAAAAAANVASNAALQAKLMADEAALSGFQSNPSQREATSLSDDMKLVNATPASILKEDNGSSSSILVAAREATRKKIEAAAAASKRAENMDAIVKAAELAAEAVSLAGKIVTMGDPLPLANLFSLGSNTCLKETQVTSEIVPRSNDTGREAVELDGIQQGPRTSATHFRDDFSDKMESHATKHGISVGVSVSGEACAMDLEGQKRYTGTDLGVTVGSVAESENGLTLSITCHNHQEKPGETSIEDNIKEGSRIEVLKDGNGFKAAWFSAVVLSLNAGKAYVEYTELTTAEGSEKLKEWVTLEGDGDEAPKIRTSRAVSAMPFEGTRKRRRAAVGDRNWCVGDRVDAWIQDSWQEGIITEKSTKDQTALTVHFPVQGETSVIKAWHLRPSFIWRDGKWTEWTRETNKSSHGGDTPQEKRQRMKSPALEEVKGKDVDSVDTDKFDDTTLHNLSASEKIFNVGKSNRDATKPGIRMTRTGLQKERSGVVFGVPKPGKKRKFMDVSKHYVAGGNAKANEANDSAKLKRHALPQPQGSVSRGWRNASKTKPIEKKVAVSKQLLKSGKPPMVFARTNTLKDKLLKTATSASDDDDVEDDNPCDDRSRSEEATDSSILISSLAQPSDTQFSKKTTSSTKNEHVSKGKLAPATGKLAKVEENKVLSTNSSKSANEGLEPRRSNRRIQPTSRLLEGLQSSLMVTKAPPSSHDRINKNRWR